MLEPVHPGSSLLAEDASEPRRLVAAVEEVGGSLVIARCSVDGQRLDLLRYCARRGAVEAVEASKGIASGDVIATALEWVPLSPEQQLLCVGFSHGGVTLFTPRGAVCISFLLVQRPVLRIRAAPPTSQAGEEQPQQLLLLQEGGALSTVSLESLRDAIFGVRGGAGNAGGTNGAGFQFRLYELQGREATADACLIDRVAPHEDIFGPPASGPCVAALGTRPFLSLHRTDAEKAGGRSLLSSAASALGSYALSWVPLRGRSFDPLTAPPLPPAGTLRPRDMQVPTRGKPEELPPAARFLDHARVGDRLEPGPRHPHGTWLGAACDAYGRVGLFCLETMRCLHLWKGYRDAQVAWLHRREGACAVGDDPTLKLLCGGADEDAAAAGLVIYAPRRGLLELWAVTGASGPRRVDAVAVDLDGSLLASRGQVLLLRRSGRIDRMRWRRPTSQPPTDAGTLCEPSATSDADSEVSDPAGDERDQKLETEGSPCGAAKPAEADRIRAPDEEEVLGEILRLAEALARGERLAAEDARGDVPALGWDGATLMRLLQQLRSPQLLGRALDALMAAHARCNEELLTSPAMEACRADPEAAPKAVLVPTLALVDILAWAVEELPRLTGGEDSGIADRLRGELDRLRLYSELLQAALCDLGRKPEIGAQAAAPWPAGSPVSEPARGDEVSAYLCWLAHQVDPSRGLGADEGRLLRTYVPSFCPAAHGREDAAALAEAPSVLPYREFSASPDPPQALLDFACRPLLLGPGAERLLARAVRALGWRPLSELTPEELRPPWAESEVESPADATSTIALVFAERLLQWFCALPEPLAMQVAEIGSAGYRCLSDILFAKPRVLLSALGSAPLSVLPRLHRLARVMAAAEGQKASPGSSAAPDGPALPPRLWSRLAAELDAWLRLSGAVAASLQQDAGLAAGGAGAPGAVALPLPLAEASASRLLCAWPATLAFLALGRPPGDLRDWLKRLQPHVSTMLTEAPPPWVLSAELFPEGSEHESDSSGEANTLDSLACAVMAHCVLAALWRYTQAEASSGGLSVCMEWIAELPEAGALRAGGALLAVELVFLGRLQRWLAVARAQVSEIDVAEVDAALWLLAAAAAAPEPGPPQQPAPIRSGGRSHSLDFLGPASPADWSGDPASRLLHLAAERSVQTQAALRGLQLPVRLLRAVAAAGLAWDVASLCPESLGLAPAEAADHHISRERELRLEFLVALGAAGHLSSALALAEEMGLGGALRAIHLRRSLARGEEAKAQEHLLWLRHDAIVGDLVREALWHRLAAAAQVLCSGTGAQQAALAGAVGKEMLDRLVDLHVDEATARFVCVDVAGALRSCAALAAHPLLQQHVDCLQETAAIAETVLHAVCGNAAGAQRPL